MRTGIELTGPLEDKISSFEEREAATFGLYTWSGWLRLKHEDRVFGVAYYRMHQLVEMHSSEAVDSESERQVRRNQ